MLSALAKYITPETIPSGVLLWHGINLLDSLGFVTRLFALIYKVLPDYELTWHELFVGAAQTAIFFTLGKFALDIYLGQTSIVSSFGAAGSLVVAVVWDYYSAQVLLFGAVFHSSRLRSAIARRRMLRTRRGAPRSEYPVFPQNFRRSGECDGVTPTSHSSPSARGQRIRSVKAVIGVSR